MILAIGRMVGETAALIYTAGTVAKVPSVIGSGSTLAVHMYNLSSEGLYMNQAYATAVVLLVLVVLINTVSGMVAKRNKSAERIMRNRKENTKMSKISIKNMNLHYGDFML